MEKVLVKFDEDGFERERQELRSAVIAAKSVVAQINAIGSYQVDNAGLNALLTGRDKIVADQIEQTTRAELQRAGIRSTSVQDAAVQGDLEKYWSIKNGFGNSSQFAPLLRINKEGQVSIDPGHDEVLREKHSYYIETERGLAIRDAYEQAVNAINELLELAPQLKGYGPHLSIFPIVPGENRVQTLRYNYDLL